MECEIDETKQGKIILSCKCGRIHSMKQNSQGDIEVKTKFVKPELEDIEIEKREKPDDKPDDKPNSKPDDKPDGGGDTTQTASLFDRFRKKT